MPQEKRQSRGIIEQLLDRADIRIGGARSWDIQIHNPRTFSRVLAQGSLGLGESYMEGWWDCGAIDEFFVRILKARKGFHPKLNPGLILFALKARLLNRQNKRLSKIVAVQHYDLGNDFYRDMLDPRMQYTCAYWKDATTLEQAQEHKLDLICRKLYLGPGMKILELGCGWGGLARFAAEKYGCEVTALNISEQQVAYARDCNRGLPVHIELKDYRDAQGLYDRVVSIGLCEHVGYKNYPGYMQVAHRCLKDGGLFLLHTIGSNKSETVIDAWMDKYIFPNATLPSIAQIGKAAESLFVMEDWHNLSTDYDLTLSAWHANFEKHWSGLSRNYDETFHRMWRYYLMLCAAVFRVRKQQLWQIVMSKNPGSQYRSLR